MAQGQAVGLIGIGLLGQALAQRLLGAGFSVTGFDLDAGKRAQLVQLGGQAASSVGEVASSCNPIVLAVFSTDQVEQVLEQELASSERHELRRTVLVASTCNPDRIALLAARVAVRGLRLLDTPVSGSSGQVARGEGVGLIGGDRAVVQEMHSVLHALFPTFFHVGEVGDGGRAKLAINLILGLNRLALAEGLVFAERLGLDLASFLQVARASACYSQVMDVKGHKMVARDFAPEGRVIQHLKDVHLIIDQAKERGQLLPLLGVHADVLESCVKAGEGDLDNCVVIEEIRRRVVAGPAQ
ncbi:MAG: NAD(P)-dependent oxidoreductase [Xanthobacteraceae bacterium]